MTQVTKIKIIAALAALMVFVQIINTVTGGAMSAMGVVPRQVDGLLGILFTPFIHHSWFHLSSNLVPFSILAFLVMQGSAREFIFASLTILIVGGFGVWLLGGSGYHAGASLIIFGFWGYLISLAVVRRRMSDILIALAVLVVYGGIVFSLFSFRPHISWSSHFFGLLAGILAAYFVHKLSKKQSGST